MGWADIPGWFDFQHVYDEAVETAPRGATLVEIGVAFGRSLAYLARRAIDAKRHDLRIVGVDPWVDDWTTPTGWKEEARPTWGSEHAEWARSVGGPFSAFVVKMRDHAPEELERVTVWRMDSFQASVAMSGDTRVHMAFIDGDHRYEAVAQDVRVWGRATILAGHDYSHDFPGVVRAVDEAFALGKTVTGTTWRRI